MHRTSNPCVATHASTEGILDSVGNLTVNGPEHDLWIYSVILCSCEQGHLT